jgi:hypothetical protein
MFSFKKSLIALVGLLVLVGTLAALVPLVSRGQGDIKNPLNRDPRKSFYLTKTLTYNGSQALSACAAGYHMASLYEIIDPSNLKYDTQLGFTYADSGVGPATNVAGFIRTGAPASGFNTPGFGNCNAWTSSSNADYGTVVILDYSWLDNPSLISPWRAAAQVCSHDGQVWCVQD